VATEGHKPVLLQQCLEVLDIKPDNIVLDATLGGAGHAKEIVAKLGARGTFMGIDADHDAIKRAEEALKGSEATVILVEGNFRELESYLGKHVIPGLDRAFFDLGWSGYQLDVGRGFSFHADEPLLMTYSKEVGAGTLTAGKIVNEWQEESIADILFGWGEEKFSRKIAQAIVEARKKKAIATSRELAEIIRGSVPPFYRKGRLHPATKTFQALRVAVNDEMGSLVQGLRSAWKSLRSGGRLAVLSFHSVEDREVKKLMREWEDRIEGKLVVKKPIQATREERIANLRARSAKLRCIEKY
jgi:16S rRNA (cytosine1402-N4)-methyltransferase